MTDRVQPDSGAPHAGRGKWFALGALAVAAVAFAVIAMSGIGENLVYYWGPSDIQQHGDKAIGATIRLGGLVSEGSIERGDGASGVAFDVTDGKHSVHVVSKGVPPQMFREGIGVVVEGTMTRAGYFECHRLMVSHDNKYRSPEDLDKVDLKELMKSTKGMDGES